MPLGRRHLLFATAAALPLFATQARAQSVEDLGNLSIEQLADVQVQSASKRAQSISEAPTSIFVITNDDILTSAATSLPEALRLAPNLQVQRIDAREYSISSRGFNGIENANKLLVLIDGRSVYSTLHSGTFWELQSPTLEDVDQIEVISGPGGTLFGPNAVNGVINVTSKDAHDTIGGFARVTAGANERTAALRYGTVLGSAGAFRIYANAFDREDEPDGTGPDVNDRFKGIQGGFRGDFGDSDSKLTLQGDLFRTDTGMLSGDGDKGGNLLARWSQKISDSSSYQIQAYYDDYVRRFTNVKDALKTFDVEGQLNLSSGGHNIVLGGGVRTTKDMFVNKLNGFVFDPLSERLWVYNAFVQDEFALSQSLSLIAGLKAEQSSFSGLELLPNLRLAWKPNDRNMVWAAVSRAVRTPSRIDRQLVFPTILLPAPDFESEKLIAIEGGYRGRFGTTTSLSVSLFYNIYDDLRTTAFTPGTIFPAQLQNGLKGHSYGLDAWLSHQLLPWWRLNLGLSTLSEHFHLKPGRNDLTNGNSLGFNPNHQILARSEMNLTHNVNFEVQGRAVDSLNRQHLKSYVEADARLGWQISDRLELHVAGNNLLHKMHEEAADPARSQMIERSVYGGTRIRF